LTVISGVHAFVEVVVEPVGDVVVGVADGGVQVVIGVAIGVAGVFTTVNEVSTLSSTIRSAAGIESLH
jgi:hypothetical protein